jgi:hypothetical protein
MFRFRIAPAIILIFISAIVAVCAQSIDLNQKASFLFNIARFVEWPADAFKTPNEPILCCFLGDAPLERKLELIKHPQFIEKRRFQFQHVVHAAQLRGCRILYISSAEQKHWKVLENEIKGQSILTVGETENFLSEGGIIRVDLNNGKIRIQINQEAANDEKLYISSRLLHLARIIDSKQ